MLRGKAFNIAESPKYDEYQKGLASIFYEFFDKNISGGAATLTRSGTLATRNKSAIKNETLHNKELAEQVHNQIIRKFEKRKVHSPFIDNICGADLADMQLISKFNEGFKFLLCVIDIYSKYPWVVTKIKKALQLLMLFKKL